MATYSLDDVRAARKERDAWWTVLLIDPVAVRFTRLLANRTSITPDQLHLASCALALVAAACFAAATPYWLALGALAYHAGFILDRCAGKIAPLKGTGTPFEPWLEYVVDRIRMLCCTVTLIGGQYVRTGRVELLYVGFAVLFLDMFCHLNVVHSARTRRAIRDRLNAAGIAGPLAGLPVRDRCEPTQVMSGVEFQMALFVVAPSTGVIAPLAMGAGGLLMAFELVAIYRLWRCARECEDLIEDLIEDLMEKPAEAARPDTGGFELAPATERPRSDVGVR
jgi:phosphatidylglycerophosphate synthase